MPHYSVEIYSKCEQLRILRENVMLVVRDYNSILTILQPKEIALFRERIRSLDKKLRPGLTKLTWVSEGVLEYFVVECRVHAYKVLRLINDYKVHVCCKSSSVCLQGIFILFKKSSAYLVRLFSYTEFINNCLV